MPTGVVGIRTTDLASSSFALMKRDVYDAIYNIDPFQTPMVQFYMANKLAKLKTGNPKFEYIEDVLLPRTTTLTGTVAASGTEQTVACTTGEGKFFKVGDVIRICATNENAVISTADSNNLKFKALDNSTALTATTAATVVIRVGSAFGEGSAAAVALSTQATQPFNYTQIFKKAVHMSGTQSASENYGGNDWTNQRIKATKEWKVEMEDSNVYGIRNILTTAGGHVRYTGGMLDSSGIGISDASQYVGNDFCTEDYFFGTYCKNLFSKGSNEKVLIAGADTVLGINNFSKVKQQTKVSEKEYGVDVQVILTPFGRLKVVWHPMLTQGATTSEGYHNWGIGIDRDDYFKYRYLSANGENRDMQYQADIAAIGTDEKKSQYLAEIGWHIAGGGQGIHRVLKPGASA